MDNPTPLLHQPRSVSPSVLEAASDPRASVDAFLIYDIICNIKDPEHPHTLEELNVVAEDRVAVVVEGREPDFTTVVQVELVPTVPHCSLATLIALCIRQKLRLELPDDVKITISIRPDSHNTAAEITRQINDKERVAAAMEQEPIKAAVAECIADVDR